MQSGLCIFTQCLKARFSYKLALYSPAKPAETHLQLKNSDNNTNRSKAKKYLKITL
jgi:hypothetical protein